MAECVKYKERELMKTIQVRNVTLGEGIPKICVPIVGVTKAEILQQAKEINLLDADLIEWRADWYEEVMDVLQVCAVLHELRSILNEKPILFTFRTANEGGEREILLKEYRSLNLTVAENKAADLIDIEAFIDEEAVGELIQNIQSHGVYVVTSNHDFKKTPEKEEIIRRLIKMQEMDADVIKIAVMPVCKQDVLTLLSATLEMNEKYADRPVVTMSMAAEGSISRMAGEIFGSALTFGAVKKVSAPGQVEVAELKQVLEIIHKGLQ